MITYDESIYDVLTSTFRFKGLKSDPKPTGKFHGRIISGESTFFEKDTQEVYFYDTDRWLPQP